MPGAYRIDGGKLMGHQQQRRLFRIAMPIVAGAVVGYGWRGVVRCGVRRRWLGGDGKLAAVRGLVVRFVVAGPIAGAVIGRLPGHRLEPQGRRNGESRCLG